MHEAVTIQPATREDAPLLVSAAAEASGGVWPAMWNAYAGADEDGDAVAVRYLTDRENDLSYRNAVIASSSGGPLGAMICFQESETDNVSSWPPLPKSLMAALRPYQELIDPESWFISELCCLPQSRGKGVGSRLLDHAKEQAAARHLPSVTLRVFSENTGAIRLYRRTGFEKVDERPVLPHPDIKMGGDVWLMRFIL